MPAGADQSRIMQEQMSGAAMAMPADTNKAFKVFMSIISWINYRGVGVGGMGPWEFHVLFVFDF